MRFDIQNQLSVAQAFAGANTVSTNAFKKQTAAQDISIGRRMALLVMSNTTAPAAGNHTLEVIQADDAALTVNVEALGSVTVAAAALALGEEVEIPVPQGTMSRQYIGFRKVDVLLATLDVYLMPQDEIAEYKSFPKINHATV